MGVAERHKAPRGPNAERRAATRAKILAAGVKCLAEFGYASTSTPLVARLAKVSRGSLLHQFPTKVDLMLAVAEHAWIAQRDFTRAQVATNPTGREQFVGGVQAIWQSLQLPEAIAFMEVMIAARTDPELAERYAEFASEREAGMHRTRRRMAVGQLSAPEHVADIDAMAHLTLAALRGLALETVFIGRPTDEAEKVLGLLENMRRRMADDISAERLRAGG
ncbi:helix-turn-helix domain-containing protein [Phenylobacterium sp.]|uniref:TetR/AcrR family transcriptional regulator n=1 Tax=Phenylobacterium sp. TaxID=1871053 RepID=UPI002DEAB607|nr:helix-turn-helix domain-containing protein [Phenylobacterium sp.]